MTLTEIGRLVQPQFPFCTLEAKPRPGRHSRQFWDRDPLEPGAWDLDLLQVGSTCPCGYPRSCEGRCLCPQPPSLAAVPRPPGYTRGLLSLQLLLSDLSLAASAWPLPHPTAFSSLKCCAFSCRPHVQSTAQGMFAPCCFQNASFWWWGGLLTGDLQSVCAVCW